MKKIKDVATILIMFLVIALLSVSTLAVVMNITGSGNPVNAAAQSTDSSGQSVAAANPADSAMDGTKAAQESATTAQESAAVASTASATDSSSNSSDGQKTFTLKELKQYNGKNGNPAYVAVDGVVYDVTNTRRWRNGQHQGYGAGQDLSAAILLSPHGKSTLVGLPVVGTLTK